MHRNQRWFFVLAVLSGLLQSVSVKAQIDPVPRQLIQLGYNAAFQGHAPISAYAFYYWNHPEFFNTNLTMRVALAPTYLDSELGISHVLDQQTDLGIGLAGGGFADSYDEIRGGTFIPKESFAGNGMQSSLSLYHCFNPGDLIPLNGLLRGIVHYSMYSRDDATSKAFRLPDDHASFEIRTGFRWGGKEPILFPALAMELSVWYEGQFRSDAGRYGYTTNSNPLGDRALNSQSHLFWGQALLAYTLTNSGQSFYINLTGGTSLDTDRFSAYRIGALLPLVAEFPLTLPGYYYQEISAKQFVMLGGNYTVPLDKKRRWNVNFVAATAGVDYLSGLEQPGHWHSGVGAGILYQTPSIKVMIGYAYGIDAIRDRSRGADSIGFLMQIDLEHAKQIISNPEEPSRWRGFEKVFGGFGG